MMPPNQQFEKGCDQFRVQALACGFATDNLKVEL
jgi:hypothetical protein